MNCPSCSSDQIQRFSTIYEAGTSIVESRSSGGGVALTGKGFVPVLTGSTSKGVQQTELAAKAAPPARGAVGRAIRFALLGSPVCAIILTIVTLIACAVFGVSSDTSSRIAEITFAGLLLLLSASGIHQAVTSHRFNRDEWPALHEEWQRKWFCHKCGAEFVADGPLRAAA